MPKNLSNYHGLIRTDIGREIVTYEQKGKERAEYGSEFLRRLRVI